MSELETYTGTVEVAAPVQEVASADLMRVSGPLMVLTWITFLIASVVLYKLVWKPILRALDAREKGIRKALDDAEKARVELASIEEKSRQAAAEAQVRSQAIVEAARASAAQVAQEAQTQARAEAQSVLDEARREIETATRKAREALRAESADLAVRLAEKVVGESMDAARSKAFIEKVMREMNP